MDKVSNFLELGFLTRYLVPGPVRTSPADGSNQKIPGRII